MPTVAAATKSWRTTGYLSLLFPLHLTSKFHHWIKKAACFLVNIIRITIFSSNNYELTYSSIWVISFKNTPLLTTFKRTASVLRTHAKMFMQNYIGINSLYNYKLKTWSLNRHRMDEGGEEEEEWEEKKWGSVREKKANTYVVTIIISSYLNSIKIMITDNRLTIEWLIVSV